MAVINQRDHHATLISCTLWPHECLIAALPQRKETPKTQRSKFGAAVLQSKGM